MIVIIGNIIDNNTIDYKENNKETRFILNIRFSSTLVKKIIYFFLKKPQCRVDIQFNKKANNGNQV